MLTLKERSAVIDEALQSENVSRLALASESYTDLGYRSVRFSRKSESGAFSMAEATRPILEQGKPDVLVDAWVEDVLRFFDAVGGSTGAVPVMGSGSEIMTECGEVRIVHEGVLCHPFPEEHARMHAFENRAHLGTKYMRFPRWGTLVNREHVAQLGGVEAIERAVEPALVRQLSGGIYVQLTSSVATALGEESMEKQRRFTELAEPLLPPPQRSLADR
jgi:hypothetical protein